MERMKPPIVPVEAPPVIRQEQMVTLLNGRITSTMIDWGAICGLEPCTLVIEALVDDQVAFLREIKFDASVDSSR